MTITRNSAHVRGANRWSKLFIRDVEGIPNEVNDGLLGPKEKKRKMMGLIKTSSSQAVGVDMQTNLVFTNELDQTSEQL